MNAEDEDTLTVTEADIAVVRLLPVVWVPIEAGAPAIIEFDEKSHADVLVYRHAMRAAEVLIDKCSLSCSGGSATLPDTCSCAAGAVSSRP